MSQEPQSRRLPWHGWLLLIVLSPLLIALVVVFLVAHLIAELALNAAVWIFWCSRGCKVLYVYSDSPIWKEHIESTVIPQFADRVVVLNWSHRRNWRISLATLVFRHFGGRKEFNPMAIVFRPFQPRVVFRFWRPFHDWKKGKTRELENMERDFLQLLSHIRQTKAEQGGPGKGAPRRA